MVPLQDQRQRGRKAALFERHGKSGATNAAGKPAAIWQAAQSGGGCTDTKARWRRTGLRLAGLPEQQQRATGLAGPELQPATLSQPEAAGIAAQFKNCNPNT